MGDVAAEAARDAIEGPWLEPPHPPGLLLAALRFAWDGVYTITETADDGRLIIGRADGRDSFYASDPLEARDAIVADFARLPVTQPLAAGALQRRIEFQRAHPDVTWGPPSAHHRVTWKDDDGDREEIAASVDGMLRRLKEHGFDWPEADRVPMDPRARAAAS